LERKERKENKKMTLSYHPTHARRLSFTPPSLFYSPTPLSIHTDFPSSAPASFPAIADGRNVGTVDALFGEWISEVEREQIIASWRGVLARGNVPFLLTERSVLMIDDECRYHGNKSGDSER